MKHLTDDQIYDLAIKIIEEQDFDDDDVTCMYHIAVCDDCYKMLRCMMAVLDVTQHMGEIAQSCRKKGEETITAVISLVVDQFSAVLTQLNRQTSRWNMVCPVQLAGARSPSEGEREVPQLQDGENPGNSIAYDPQSRMLMIRLEARRGKQPRAILETERMGRQEISLTEQSGSYWADVPGLENGTYQLILER